MGGWRAAVGKEWKFEHIMASRDRKAWNISCLELVEGDEEGDEGERDSLYNIGHC
jgi:hypothetical protein